MLESISSGDWDAVLRDVTMRVSIVLIAWLFMVVSSFIDLWSGVSTAKALGEPIQSSGLRRTFVKIGDYIKVALFMLMGDALGCFIEFYDKPYATIVCSLAVILIEGKSVVENSRRKKANAGNIPDTIAQIMEATTPEQAKKIIEFIKENSGKHANN